MCSVLLALVHSLVATYVSFRLHVFCIFGPRPFRCSYVHVNGLEIQAIPTHLRVFTTDGYVTSQSRYVTSSINNNKYMRVAKDSIASQL